LGEIPAIVERYRPVIYQGFKSLYDYPTKIEFGPFQLGNPKDDMKVKPVLYYWVRGDIVGFMAYYPKDWSDCIFGEIIPGGEHWNDTQGGLVHKNENGKFESVTIWHHKFKYGEHDYDPVWMIESHGHGVSPTGLHLPGCIHWSKEAKVDYISLDSWGEGEWLSTQAMFGDRVNLPDRWIIDGYNFFENPKEVFESIKRRHNEIRS